MSYNLFLDDERLPQNVKWVELPPVAWTIIRNYQEFVNILNSRGLPAIITFDHDLADEHYQEYQWAHSEQNLNKGQFQYDKMKEKTGYECAKYLVDFCLKTNQPLPQYFIHTLNPIGRENIKSLLENYQKHFLSLTKTQT